MLFNLYTLFQLSKIKNIVKNYNICDLIQIFNNNEKGNDLWNL